MIPLPTVDELSARYATACDLKQAVDRVAIAAALKTWMRRCGGPSAIAVSFVSSSAQMLNAAQAAWEARAAQAVRAAWEAQAAAARAAAARAAARAERAAWDTSWTAVTAIGAVSLGDAATAKIWLPIFEAFEAGAFAFWVGTDRIYAATMPTVVAVDGNFRLHCETGPAFKWLDDLEDYYWRGTCVPKEWIIDRHSLTAATVLSCSNLEQRRAGIEMLGWNRILTQLKTKVIDADGDPQIGTLIEVELPDLARPARFMRVRCGTGREFTIGVPPEMRTAMEAQAWMQGLPAAKFVKPQIRT